MNVTVRTVLGGAGPEGFTPVLLRAALRDALAPVRIDGLDELDLFIRIGGTVTPAEGEGGLHNARYLSASRRFTANLLVPPSVIESVGLAVALTDLFAVLADRAVTRVAPGGAAAADALRSALTAARRSLV